MKDEQDRIAERLARIEIRLEASLVNIEVVENNLRTALNYASNCYAGYVEANPSVRRLFNQAFFERVYLEQDHVRCELAEPFKTLLGGELIADVADHSEESEVEQISGIAAGDQRPAADGVELMDLIRSAAPSRAETNKPAPVGAGLKGGALVHPSGPLSNREGLKEPVLVHVTGLFSNFSKPLERLIAKLGELPGGTGDTPRKRLVHKVSSPKSGRRSYKPNRKLSPEEVRCLVTQYEAGMSIADLARQFDMHTQTVDSHLKRQGVQKRGVFKLSPEQINEVAKLYRDGWSTIEIAKEFGVTTNTVGRGLVRAGVTLRSSVDSRWYTKKSSTRGRR